MASIRTARPSDTDEVVALWEVAAGPTRLPGNPHVVRRLIERDGEALLVAEQDGEIVATLIVGWDGWRCHLYRLAVRADARRLGLGTSLVAHAREHATRVGARRLDAMVDDDNELGRQFWSAIGFTTGESDDRRWTSPVG